MTTPGAGPLRAAVERRSAVAVVYLSRQRRVLVALAPLVLLVGLLVARGPVALLPGLLLLAVVGWLAYLSWPHLAPGPRVVRLLGVAAVLALATIQTAR